MAESDYYKILGVPSGSSESQIRKHYQQLAKKHHPDHQGDESSMIIINRAYEVLSNSAKRIEYDRLRRLRLKRHTEAKNTRQYTHNYRHRTYRKAEVANNDLVIIVIFIIILLVAVLGLR